MADRRHAGHCQEEERGKGKREPTIMEGVGQRVQSACLGRQAEIS